MPSLTKKITHQSDVERRILREMMQRIKFWQQGISQKVEKWKAAEEKTLAYMPEREVDAARRANREGGLPEYTTIQIPYSYAVVMATHTYLTSVFMARDPVFQYTGRHGESQQQVQAVEALIAYQLMNASMQKYIFTWLYDAPKYGVAVVGNYWEEKLDVFSSIDMQEEADPLTGQPIPGSGGKVLSREMTRTYAGNCVYNIQPQSFIWDTRVTMREFQKGEFCGEHRLLGWNEVVRREKMGYYTNVRAIKRGTGQALMDLDRGSSQLERPNDFSQMDAFTDQENGRPMQVGVYQLVIEIIPKEWSIGQSDWPEKWVFTCTDDYNVLIGAQPLGMRHCQYPYDVIPLEPEGYGLTTRGLPELLKPVQDTIDWLINSHFHNVRAAMNNQWVADPSRIVMKDLLSKDPGKVIRLKPEAYGTDPKLAIAQLPVMDVTRNHLADFQMMLGVGERVGGANDQIMGMLADGGRKTATEVRTSTSFGINRLKTIAEFASTCAFDPLSKKLVQNSQQFYDMEMKLRIVGDLAMNAGQKFLMVTPQDIGGFYDFVPVDGTLPIDRMAQVGLWKELFQAILSIPQIGMQYDLGGIFTWVGQLAGLKNINQFKIQLTPDQVLATQMQQGNSVPLGGGKAPGPSGPMATGAPAGMLGAA